MDRVVVRSQAWRGTGEQLDRALASAVIVTTVTDCVGFGLFLGLATLFLPLLT